VTVRRQLEISGLRVPRTVAAMAAVLLGAAVVAEAHHTYALFDSSKTLTVSGTVAKLEWTNPHTFVWVYVPSTETAGKYDLYAFENGSPNAVSKAGWSKTTVQAGDKITVDFAPLRDGRKGGHLLSVKLNDGRTLYGVGIKPPPDASTRGH
jgi:hypothetical protein